MALSMKELTGLGLCSGKMGCRGGAPSCSGLGCAGGACKCGGRCKCGGKCGGEGCGRGLGQSTASSTTSVSGRRERQAPVKTRQQLTQEVVQLDYLSRQQNANPHGLASRIWSIRRALMGSAGWSNGSAHGRYDAKDELVRALEAIERRVGVGSTSPKLAAQFSGGSGMGSWLGSTDPVAKLAGCIRVALCRPSAFCCPGGAEPVTIGGRPGFASAPVPVFYQPQPQAQPQPPPFVALPAAPPPVARPYYHLQSPGGTQQYHLQADQQQYASTPPFTPVPALQQPASPMIAVRGETLVVPAPAPVPAPALVVAAPVPRPHNARKDGYGQGQPQAPANTSYINTYAPPTASAAYSPPPPRVQYSRPAGAAALVARSGAFNTVQGLGSLCPGLDRAAAQVRAAKAHMNGARR